MSGIYIHIPFCKQACYYCDFHFSTSLKKKDELVQALTRELELRKDELKDQIVETIYFGGGTPSILSNSELSRLLDAVYRNYTVTEDPEITLEANPDDLTNRRIKELLNTPVNRLSIGIQSFFEDDLKLMNRAHDADDARRCLEEACNYFNNITIDLIYGIPGLTQEKWEQNIETALSFNIPHISSYALTVEPKTALHTFIKKGLVAPLDEGLAQEQFYRLIEKLEASGFIHYELSNFGKPGYFSKNNSAYWLRKPYLGIGPSAHSYNGQTRGWNVRNNSKYIKALQQDSLPTETETLTENDKYNEYIMTGLRTIWGVSVSKVLTDFGTTYKKYLLEQSQRYMNQHLLYLDEDKLLVTKEGKFLSDGIITDLFKLD